MKIIVIYDNNIPKNEIISDVAGDKSFADVIIKKRRTEEYIYDNIKTLFKDIVWKRIDNLSDYSEVIKYIAEFYEEDVKILQCFSNYFIKDFEKVSLSYNKLYYIDEPYRIILDRKIAGLMFPDAKKYVAYCKNIIAGQSVAEAANAIVNYFEIEGLVDLSITNNIIRCITGYFDSRYFNTLKEDEYTVTKISVDKLKIKKEYTYYRLLPEDMKFWFVMPYDYREEQDTASYKMERLHMTDLAVKYVHGSIDEAEFDSLLNRYFYFFSVRHSRICSPEKYKDTASELYADKVISRIDELKKHQNFEQISKYLSAGKINLDELVEEYFLLKSDIENRNNYPKVEVIGHGDPGFANALYNKATQTLKFIDPKGAISEDQLWTNPYYDIAKLSHCICGKYDFFNNGLFEIKVNEQLSCELNIPFNNDIHKQMFRKKLLENGFDYNTVRIYEVSLFLSMLPLHIDNPYKVFGFILNVKNILREIKNDF